MRPVCTEMWPGNTVDTGSLIRLIDRLRKRYRGRRVQVAIEAGADHVLALLGHPVCTEMRRCNAVDSGSLNRLIDRLRKRCRGR